MAGGGLTGWILLLREQIGELLGYSYRYGGIAGRGLIQSCGRLSRASEAVTIFTAQEREKKKKTIVNLSNDDTNAKEK